MTTLDFLLQDQAKTFFPNKTNQLLFQHGESLIQEYIGKCFAKSDPSHSFLPQHRAYAAKHDRTLRRTVKLDPVADYYIYDVVYRHRSYDLQAIWHLFRPHPHCGDAHVHHPFAQDFERAGRHRPMRQIAVPNSIPAEKNTFLRKEAIT
ncbi:hypothetical protein ACO2JO_18630 [Leptospira interrogans]